MDPHRPAGLKRLLRLCKILIHYKSAGRTLSGGRKVPKHLVSGCIPEFTVSRPTASGLEMLCFLLFFDVLSAQMNPDVLWSVKTLSSVQVQFILVNSPTRSLLQVHCCALVKAGCLSTTVAPPTQPRHQSSFGIIIYQHGKMWKVQTSRTLRNTNPFSLLQSSGLEQQNSENRTDSSG